ncbi:type II secretion system protein GspD, partial [Escherichia coli]|nr:type II secretion system protein GspD [Escherichia coli]
SSASTSGGIGSAMQSASTTGTTMQSVQTQTPKGFVTPELTVQPAPELNAVVVRGTPAAIASIEPLITDLDVRRPQVLIEAA